MPDRLLHLTFLGTRGEIEIRSARHRWHSALLVQYQDHRVMLDCGADWLDRVAALHPSAILLTHAHPDHAWGLAHGAPCPVYATAETWTTIEHYPIVARRVVEVGHRFHLGPVMWEPFAVEHSTRAPAVGYRFAFEETVLFYVPDVAVICDQHAAIHGVTLYIGDGASIVRPLLRRRGDLTIGHASIRTQLAWCQAEGVTRAMFTHCGSQIVRADGRSIAARLRRLGHQYGVAVRVAYDGLCCAFPPESACALLDHRVSAGRAERHR
jgi:phosphoribosyl 1,2-cyclic phosphodiesterase